MYGGQQEAFEKASARVVQTGIDLVRKAGGNYKRVFFDLLGIFERARADIAKEARSNHAVQFGRRRDTSGVSTCYYTYLDRQYLAYGDRMKSILAEQLPDLMAGKNPKKGNSDCQIHFRTFDIPDPKKASDYLRPLKPVQETPDEKCSEEELQATSDEITAFRKQLSLLKERDPAKHQYTIDYTTALAYNAEAEMAVDLFSIPPNLLRFVTAEVFWKRGDQLIPATSYTCLYDSTLPPDDAVEALKENPTELREFGEGMQPLVQQKPCVLVKHMDREHIQETLEEVAAIFERAVARENPDESTLKGDLAALRHRFSFAMPEERGAGAIAEWFESAVAGLHGFRARRRPGTMGDLEALTTPYAPNFPKKYASHLTLEKISS